MDSVEPVSRCGDGGGWIRDICLAIPPHRRPTAAAEFGIAIATADCVCDHDDVARFCIGGKQNTPAAGAQLTATSTITPAAAPIGQPANTSPTDVDSLLSTNNHDTLFGGGSEQQETFVAGA